jgi:hypothetical protein
VHRHHHDVPTYTGAGLAYPSPQQHSGHGFCHSCCHPTSKCCCHRECRKESRELLAQGDARGDFQRSPNFSTFGGLAAGSPTSDLPGQPTPAEPKGGTATAFIGGACCVYLSIEYVPQSPTAESSVAVLVVDGEGTKLGWG